MSTTLQHMEDPNKETIHQKEHIALFLRPQPDSVAMDHTTQDFSSAAGAAEVDGRRHEEKEDSQSSDKFPAPSTPQLEAEQSSRSLDDRDREDQLNCSIDVLKEYFRDPMEHTGFGAPDSQSVDNTCKSPAVEISKEESSTPAELSTEKKPHPAHQSRDNECAHPEDPLAPSPHLDPDERLVQNADDLNRKKASPHHTSSYLDDSRSNKKRIKVDWTPDLHRRFVQAVEQLGIDQAIPSKILELMKVEGLTRHNVASHLQKYRMRKRHILPKDEDRRWQQQGNQVPRGYTYQPFVALPPAHSSCVMPPGQVYHVWGHPNYPFPGVQMWGGATGCSPWQPTGEYWPWKTYPRMHADAWGYPVAPQNLYPVAPQNPPQNRCFDAHEHQQSASKDAACDFHPAEEVIDEVVREALNKPWLPLPLGLKPPSTESVLTELHRLGVHSVPPR